MSEGSEKEISLSALPDKSVLFYLNQTKGPVKMRNPWAEIPLTDYENHMKLDSVLQLQTMNELMREQFKATPHKALCGVAFKKLYSQRVRPQEQSSRGLTRCEYNFLRACSKSLGF